MNKCDKISIILLWASIVLLALKFTYYPRIELGWVFAPPLDSVRIRNHRVFRGGRVLFNP